MGFIFAAGLITLVIVIVLIIAISCKQSHRRKRLGYTIKESDNG